MQHTYLERKILLSNESLLILMFEEVLQTFGAELGNGLSNSSTRPRPKKVERPHMSYNHFSGMPWGVLKTRICFLTSSESIRKGSDLAIRFPTSAATSTARLLLAAYNTQPRALVQLEKPTISACQRIGRYVSVLHILYNIIYPLFNNVYI